MQRTKSQKVLTVVAVLEIAEALLEVTLAVLAIWALAMAVEGGVQLPELLRDIVDGSTRLGVDEATVIVVVSMVVLNLAIVDGLLGALTLRAAYNPHKIKPVWILSLVSLVLSVVSVGLLVAGGLQGDESFFIQLLALAVDAVTFWAANDVRKLTVAG